MSLGLLQSITSNGTDFSLCVTSDFYAGIAVIPASIILLMTTRLVVDSPVNYLGIFNVIPLLYVVNYFYDVDVYSRINFIFSDMINAFYINMLPLIAIVLIGFMSCIRVIGEAYLVFAMSAYILASLAWLTNIITSASITAFVVILSFLPKTRQWTRTLINSVSFGFAIFMSIIAEMTPISATYGCRNYYVLCRINCPIITLETSDYEISGYAVSAVVVLAAGIVGQMMENKCKAYREKKRLKKLHKDIEGYFKTDNGKKDIQDMIRSAQDDGGAALHGNQIEMTNDNVKQHNRYVRVQE
jgi:hypothetical protein